MNLKNYKKISAILLLFVMLIPLQLHAKISKKIKTIALEAYSEKPFRNYFQTTDPIAMIKLFEGVVESQRSPTA